MTIDDWYTKAILDQTENIAMAAAKSMDEYLLSFFGSIENAKRYAHLYILEEHPYKFETKVDDNNVVTYTAHTTYRLRLKTEEELRQARD
jgi:hypothetical protein